MEIRTEKKLVEIMQTTNIYIAEDGKEFDNKIDCENYEKELESAKLRAEAEIFELKELEDTYPLDAEGGEVPENSFYKWYKVNNAEELNAVANLYNADFGEFKTYPQTICVEYDYYYDEYKWIYTLSDMQRQTIEFWKKHGFDVEVNDNTDDIESLNSLDREYITIDGEEFDVFSADEVEDGNFWYE